MTARQLAPGQRASLRAITVSALDSQRVRAAKRAFSTRRVLPEAMKTLVSGQARPRTGDLVLARIDRIGHHTKLELTDGRRSHLHIGDEIIVAYGHRYAPDQFESEVPIGLGPTHLVAGGGIASQMLTRSQDARRPTDITPLGLIGTARGRVLNLAEFALPQCLPAPARIPTIAVLGTSMNSGKTTTMHWLVHALARAGHRPGATKVTGTGSGGDFWVMLDAGAHTMLDFTDAGFATTYRIDITKVERKAIELIDHLASSGCGCAVVEVADGVFQRETARLIESAAFRERLDGVIFAASDAMGAVGGLNRLRQIGLPVLGVSGRFTRSPLAVREAEECCDVPVLDLDQLADPVFACNLLGLEPPHGMAMPEGSDVVYEREDSVLEFMPGNPHIAVGGDIETREYGMRPV